MPSEKAILLPQRTNQFSITSKRAQPHAVYRIDTAVHHVDEVPPFGTLLARQYAVIAALTMLATASCGRAVSRRSAPGEESTARRRRWMARPHLSP
jgi:hypothetical protein